MQDPAWHNGRAPRQSISIGRPRVDTSTGRALAPKSLPRTRSHLTAQLVGGLVGARGRLENHGGHLSMSKSSLLWTLFLAFLASLSSLLDRGSLAPLILPSRLHSPRVLRRGCRRLNDVKCYLPLQAKRGAAGDRFSGPFLRQVWPRVNSSRGRLSMPLSSRF